MSRKHILYLTEEEIKALANGYRVAVKMQGHTEYIENLQAGGGKSAFDKLMEKIREINESQRE